MGTGPMPGQEKNGRFGHFVRFNLLRRRYVVMVEGRKVDDSDETVGIDGQKIAMIVREPLRKNETNPTENDPRLP
jgi:hypothetical protein